MATILLVDDNADLLQLTARYLFAAGHSVTTAVNGREAMRAVSTAGQAPAGTFDLVITDLVMPEQEGLETITALRRSHPDIKIIAMSGGTRTDPGTNLRIAQKLGAATSWSNPSAAPNSWRRWRGCSARAAAPRPRRAARDASSP